MCTDQIAPLNLPKPSSEVTKAAVATQTLIRANHSPAKSQSLSIQQTQGSDLQNRESKEIVCDDAQDLKGIDSVEDRESDDKTDDDDQNEADQDSDEDKESEDKTDGDDQNEADQAEWTHVFRRRRRKVNLPQCWKLRFPAHLRAGLHTPSESSSSASSSEMENDPNSTPVAARTRSKLKT